MVEKGTQGFSTTKMEGKLALRMVQNADITLDDCVVDEDHRLQQANSFADTADVLRLTRWGWPGGRWAACVRPTSWPSPTPRSGSSSAC